MKPCPFCGEPIQDVALKCRFCGEWLDPSRRPEAVGAPAPAFEPARESTPPAAAPQPVEAPRMVGARTELIVPPGRTDLSLETPRSEAPRPEPWNPAAEGIPVTTIRGVPPFELPNPNHIPTLLPESERQPPGARNDFHAVQVGGAQQPLVDVDLEVLPAMPPPGLAPGRASATPLAPQGTLAPATPLAPQGTLAPATPLAPTSALASATPLAPTSMLAPATPLAPTSMLAPATPLAPASMPAPAPAPAPAASDPAPFQARSADAFMQAFLGPADPAVDPGDDDPFAAGPPPPPPPPWPKIAAAVGGLLVVLFLFREQIFGPSEAAPDEPQAGAETTPPETPEPAPKPEPPPETKLAETKTEPKPAPPPLPTDPEFAERLARAKQAYSDGKLKAASAALTDLAKQAPEHPEVLLLTAQVQLEEGKVAESRATVDRCVAVDPNLADCWLTLGVLRQNSKDDAGAAAAYETYLKLSPTGRYARDANSQLARLKRSAG